jgi:hypothetical protein
MQNPSIPSTQQDNPPRSRLLAALVLLAVAACARPAPPDAAALARVTAPLEAALARDPAPAPGALRVRLAFGAGADLDLFVTDPLAETVYFANSPSRSGGRLLRDQRCDAPAPRIETIVFDSPPPGRYRVGVDHPEACDGNAAPAAFVLILEHAGRREERRGAVAPREFLPIVLELEARP